MSLGEKFFKKLYMDFCLHGVSESLAVAILRVNCIPKSSDKVSD